MTVKNGDFIRIEYAEFVDGKVIAATDRDVAKANEIYEEEVQYGPHLIVVGAGQLVKGFEEDLLDKEIGYSGRVEIPPEKAFGTRDPTRIQTIPITRFKEEKPAPGMRVGVEGKTGTITRVIGRKVTIDFNHPLADKAIVYEYKIVEKIEDQNEKLKALIKTFTRMDLESEIKDDVAVITAPWELGYYKEWLMVRRGLADMILRHLGLAEVDYVEKHAGARVTAELVSPPGKEPEPGIQAEQNVEATDVTPA